jgi:nitrogen regulatory protein PII-like uncharacterized protein
MNISREHIAFTLGIPIPLNESVNVSESLRLRIIHEQLIYESFLDSIKTFAKEKFNQVITTIKDWKDAAVVIGKVLSNGDLLNDFLKPLERRVEKLIQPLTDFLKKIKLDSFIEKIKQFIDKIKSLQGWKKFMALVTAGSIITFIIEKLKSLAPDAVKDFLTKYFSPTFVTDVLGKLTDFQSYLGFLQPIVKGVEIIFNFLKPLIEAFAVALKSGGKLATKLIKENKMKKSDLKKLIKEQILNELETGKPEVVTLSKYLATAGKTALSSINDINELESVLNMIFDGMNTTLKSSSKLTPLLNKLKTKFK